MANLEHLIFSYMDVTQREYEKTKTREIQYN